MLEWDGFRYFLALQRRGTLKEAADDLGVDQTTVGRRISALEASLGTRLFEKRSDGFQLTLAGERILSTVMETEGALLSIERVIAGREEKAEGRVKIAMPGAMANHWLIPRLEKLTRRFPGIELELLTGPEVVNLAKREADLALRLVKPSQQELIARKLGQIKLGLFGHHALWAKGGKPSHKADLENFSFVGLYSGATSELEWSLLKKIQPHLRYKIRSAAWSSVFYALKARLGIGILPTFIAETDPNLIQLPVVDSVSAPFWLVAHPDIVSSARVRAVMDFILSQFESREAKSVRVQTTIESLPNHSS